MTTDLDHRLATAAPDRDLADAVTGELDALVAGARDAHTTRARRRRNSVLGAGVLGMALLGGTATAAASGVLPWTGWTIEPDAIVRLDYVATTSGGPYGCEVAMRIEPGLDPAVADAARRYLAEVDQDAPLGEVDSETTPYTPEDFPDTGIDRATLEATLAANWWSFRVWVAMGDELGTTGLVDYGMTMPSETHCEPLP
ncbi:hypothetical protein [Protaetiibacter intestinalis]|uniref:hypothetical protein n=1 Tax=Protaetiibacter intestinalis TaxID=2419774 RepID=UPI001D03E98B|nr:hypothetical protein [Protaetiibacter intestinalis]